MTVDLNRAWLLTLLAVSSILALTACSEDIKSTPVPTSTATPTATSTATPAPTSTPVPEPTRTSTPVPQASIVDQLRKNAEEFEYATGKHGGTLTFATISEPLTFNLAIANDASSSGVPCSRACSWLTDQVESMLAESWEHSEDGMTWTFHLREDVRWRHRA